MKSGLPICLAIGFVTACRSTTPREPNPGGAIQPSPAGRETPPLPENRNKIWHIQPAMSSQRYQITSTISLELAAVRDSITSITAITLNTQPTDTAIIFSGTLDTVALRTGGRIGSLETLPRLPLAFAGALFPNAVRVSAPSDCTPAAVSPGSFVPRISITFPTTSLIPGLVWSDSVTFFSCNGELPISTTTVRSFRVVGEEIAQGSPAILISRTDRFEGHGNGSQDQHRVEISSAGTGSARLWISANTGRLIQSTGRSSGTVTVLASGRRQVFNQTIIERIEVRN